VALLAALPHAVLADRVTARHARRVAGKAGLTPSAMTGTLSPGDVAVIARLGADDPAVPTLRLTLRAGDGAEPTFLDLAGRRATIAGRRVGVVALFAERDEAVPTHRGRDARVAERRTRIAVLDAAVCRTTIAAR